MNNKKYQEAVKEYVILSSANILNQMGGKLFNKAIYVTLWCIVLGFDFGIYIHTNDLDPPVLLPAYIMGGLSLAGMVLTITCFNRMNLRWYLYFSLLCFSVSVSYTMFMLTTDYNILGDWFFVLLLGYLIICIASMCIIKKQVKIRVINGYPKEQLLSKKILVPGAFCLVGMIFSKYVSIFAMDIFGLIIMVMLQCFSASALTIYQLGKKCDIPEEMLFSNKNTTIKGSEGADEKK